ncbi:MULTISPECIES: exodeoxyribonuclease III [unclassified Xanthobacter]|uniref:exodeoxyribonuclease III n=1 Tax=unclassified Xanthobacter TaxID=2623496 RepID=UPI001F372A2C|nr:MULTISPECIES: exodeoxyribonuclease III [unclassified Xanthobacter]
MRIATWNVNSIRQRLDHAVAWLKEANPDVVCFQEIKCQNDAFPKEPFEQLGYNVSVHGQKTFNGVALLSKLPLEDVTHGLAGDDGDEQARFIEAVVSVKTGVVRVACIYLPNGNPPNTEKYPYKLGFMERLKAFTSDRLKLEEPLILAGDFNVIPAPADAADPSAWTSDALFLPRTRNAFRELMNLGLTDAIRACTDAERTFTFWDYQAGAWQRDFGIRIDHLLLSPQAADRLLATGIDKHVRAWEKPSDHVPVWADFSIAA